MELTLQEINAAGVAMLDGHSMYTVPDAPQPADGLQLPAIAASLDAPRIKEEQPAVSAADPVRHQPQPHDTAGQVGAAGDEQNVPADVWAQDGLVSTCNSVFVMNPNL